MKKNVVLTKKQLKELVKRIVVAQGNAFIKELLRSTGSKIGATKEDFAKNLDDAIDKDIITQEMLETWLAEVEGWGDQYLYLFNSPKVDTETLAAGIAASPYAKCQDSGVSLDFPEGLELKHITLDKASLSIVWHQSKQGWNRWKVKDHFAEMELERFRYEAYRQRFDRSVVRYEWRFDYDSCAILIHRNPDIDHEVVHSHVQEALYEMGFPTNAPLARIPLSQAVKIAARNDKGVHTTRFELDNGYVEMGSTLPEGGIESVKEVRGVLHAVDTNLFDRAQGMLHFVEGEHGTSRRIAVQVYGSEGKLRIWAQCKRDDVFKVVELLWGYNNEI